MLKKIVGVVSILFFVYMTYLQGTLGIAGFLNIAGLLNLAYLAGGVSLLLNLPKMIGIISGLALLVRSYMYSSLILTLTILIDPISLISLILIPVGILYFSITDAD